MSHQPLQNVKNHARFYPIFHFIALPVLALNFLYEVYLVVRTPSTENLIDLVVALALVCLALSARTFALSVQDRVIRLEEQVRFSRIFPDELRNRIPEFTRDQFIALRFASDQEVTGLARTVLDQRITDRNEIKRMVTDWRADHLRA